MACIGGRLFPPLFSHLHFAIFVIVFGAGGQCGGWRVAGPKWKYLFGVCLGFRWGTCAPRRKGALAVLVGAFAPRTSVCQPRIFCYA